MKSKSNLLIIALISLSLFWSLSACSDDNSTGNQEDCTMSLPSEFTPVTIDNTYFQSQTEPDPQDDQYSTYFQVQQAAETGNAFFSGEGDYGFIELANALLTFARNSEIEPEFENGSCVWTINPPSGSTGGLDLTVTAYATPVDDGVDWEIIYDGDLSDDDVVEDYKVLTGFTSSDESNGEWNYYSVEDPESPDLVYTWSIESDDVYELSVSTTGDDFGTGEISYEKNGSENFMTFDSADGIGDVYWNEDNDSGWIEREGEERMCYTDFVNSACS